MASRCLQYLYLPIVNKKTHALFNKAINAGARGLDTAREYDSEKRVGEDFKVNY
jgi:diketogulonate reductase-like aldo/keto reductase